MNCLSILPRRKSQVWRGAFSKDTAEEGEASSANHASEELENKRAFKEAGSSPLLTWVFQSARPV